MLKRHSGKVDSTAVEPYRNHGQLFCRHANNQAAIKSVFALFLEWRPPPATARHNEVHPASYSPLKGSYVSSALQVVPTSGLFMHSSEKAIRFDSI